MAAPEQNIVDVSWDYKKFDEQTQLVIKNMEAVYNEAKKFTDFKISPGSTGGFTELAAMQKKVQETTAAVTKENENLVSSINKVVSANKTQSVSTEEVTVATVKQTKSITENIKGINDYKAAIKDASAQQKQLTKDADAGRISADEYRKKNTELSETILRLKARQADLRKETSTQIKDAIGLNGAYAKLNQQYLIAQTNAKNLAATYGIESKQAVAAAATANNLSNQLKAIDATVGQSQRNVGNYASAIGGAFNKVFGALRTIANIIPGLGIGGIFLGLYEVTKLLVQSTGELSSKQKTLNSVYEDAAKSASGQVATLTLLKSKLTDLNIPLQDRKKYAEEYNKIAAEGNKIDLTQLNNLELINAQILKQIELIKARALARAAEAKLEEQAAKVIEAQLETKQFEKFANARKLNSDEIKDANKTDIKEQESNNKLNQKANSDNLTQQSRFLKVKGALNSDAISGQENYIKAKRKLDKEQAELDRQASLLSPLLTPDSFSTKGKVAGAATKDSVKERIDAEFEIYKIGQQRKIKLLDEELKDTKKSYGDRLILAEMYNDSVVELANKTAAKEIKQEQEKLDALQSNLKKAKGTERNNLLVEIANTQDKIKIITAKNQDELLTIESDYSKRRQQIADDEESKRLAGLAKQEQEIKNARTSFQTAIEADTALRIASLDKQLHDGTIKQRQYTREKAKIENDALILSLQNQQAELVGLREVAKARGEDITNLSNQIMKVQGLIQSAQNKPTTEKDKSKPDDFYYQLEIKAAETFFAIATKLADAQHERRLKQLQEEKDAIDANYQAEVTAITNSTLSEQEKAAQISILTAQQAAKKEQIAQKEREEKIKQAKTDKAIGIAKIIVETALAVVHQLTSGDPYTAYARAALAGAAGAAELATAIATPIPSYFKETDNHPGGPARYGEVPEVVSEPGKRPYVQWTETIGMLPKGTKVKHLTSDDVMAAAGGAMVHGMAERLAIAERAEQIRQDNKDLIQAVVQTGRETVRALRGQRHSTVINIYSRWAEKIDKEVRR